MDLIANALEALRRGANVAEDDFANALGQWIDAPDGGDDGRNLINAWVDGGAPPPAGYQALPRYVDNQQINDDSWDPIANPGQDVRDAAADLAEAVAGRREYANDMNDNLVEAPWRSVIAAQDIADAWRADVPLHELAIATAEAMTEREGAQRDDRFLYTVRFHYLLQVGPGDAPIAGQTQRITFTDQTMPAVAAYDEEGVARINSRDGEDAIARVVEDVIVDNFSMEERMIRAWEEGRGEGRGYYARRRGAFFDYVVDDAAYRALSIDLAPYQIFSESDWSPELTQEQCLVYAAEQAHERGQLDRITLECLREQIKTREISKGSLKEIAKEAGLNITLSFTELKSDKKKTVKIPGRHDPALPTLKLGLLENHYFIDEEVKTLDGTQPPLFAVRHLGDCIAEAAANEARGAKWYSFTRRARRGGNAFTYTAGKASDRSPPTSFDLVRALLSAEVGGVRVCAPLSVDQRMAAGRGLTGIVGSVSEAVISRPVTDKEPKAAAALVYYFDTEADTSDPAGHRPYCASAAIADGSWERTHYGLDAVDNLLTDLAADVRARGAKACQVYAHNLGYDASFIFQSKQAFAFRSVISAGTSVWQVCCSVPCAAGPVSVTFRDSYKLISMPLSAFPKSFGFEGEKEVYPYGLYRIEDLGRDVVEEGEVAPFIDRTVGSTEWRTFLERVDAAGARRGKTQFSKEAYSRFYCRRDVEILRRGMEQFMADLAEEYGLDARRYLSIAAVGDALMRREGAYDGVHELAGAVQVFIAQCAHGGRVMTRLNKKYVLEGRRVADFDAVSLYPSAMAMEGFGFPTGAPEPIAPAFCGPVVDAAALEAMAGTYSAWFAEVVIESVAVRLDFPLVIKHDPKLGVKNYDDEVGPEGVRMFVDSRYASDLLRYQGARFRVVCGYGFRGELNHRVRDVIKDMFDHRLRLKKERKPSQLVVKLLMNSSYGRSLLKPQPTKLVVKKTGEELRTYVRRNYENIREIKEMGERWAGVTCSQETLSHYNRAHCGALILSASKQIMNRVMVAAQHLGVSIWYQDTDSMHVYADEVPRLAAALDAQDPATPGWVPKLIGKGMGSFHTDFDLGGCDPDTVAAKTSIFLGKKAYLDVLEGTKYDGSAAEGVHYRLKGVSARAVRVAAADFGGVEPLYRHMAAGGEVLFDLALAEEGKPAPPCFKRDTLASVRSLMSFTRRVRFPGEAEAVRA